MPISKSIANRVLVRKALRGEDLRSFLRNDMPEDVRVMAACLSAEAPKKLDVGNCGTAMRFLTAYFAAKEGADLIIDGCARMRERPMGQEVEALRELGAEIDYLGKPGFPPLHIHGRKLQQKRVHIAQPQSTQFVSALLLIGADVTTDAESPYIEMTKAVVSGREEMEADWSAAAFWFERKALGLVGELEFPGLKENSLQGDKAVADIFRRIEARTLKELDCSRFPDLVPAIAVTCHALRLDVKLIGTESLRLKESDRMRVLEENFRRIKRGVFPLLSCEDHRIAMAFMAAGYAVDNTACIRKSYPRFLEQLLDITRLVVTANGQKDGKTDIRTDGLTTLMVPDRGKGRKQALSDGMSVMYTRYVWINGTDVEWPDILPPRLPEADLIILPLRMTAPNGTLLEHLQQIEFAAIQELALRSARRGHPALCFGSNMIVNREAWTASWPYLHHNTAWGEDMFLLESFKRRGRRIVMLEHYAASVQAQPTWRDVVGLRKKRAGELLHYRDRDFQLLCASVLVSNLLVVACPPWLVIKWIADTLLVRSRLPRMRHLLGKTLLMTVVYPWYVLAMLIAGLFSKRG